MDIIKTIAEKYNGNISLKEPYNGVIKFPFECSALEDILRRTNGITGTMPHPKTGKIIEISRIIYSYEQMKKESEFFAEEYDIVCIPFSDNGADITYFFKADGKIYGYDPIDAEEFYISDDLEKFFGE